AKIRKAQALLHRAVESATSPPLPSGALVTAAPPEPARAMISVVIPVYNEAGCLPAHVAPLVPLLTSLAGNGWEIVLVDDGSTDGTGAVIGSLAARDAARVRGVAHAKNRGKGAAVRTGVLATRGDAVLFCDADMSTPPETLREFLGVLAAGADVVVGNRKGQGATIERWQPRIRTWLGLGFTRLAN